MLRCYCQERSTRKGYAASVSPSNSLPCQREVARRSTRKGYAASVRQQSCQRLRSRDGRIPAPGKLS